MRDECPETTATLQNLERMACTLNRPLRIFPRQRGQKLRLAEHLKQSVTVDLLLGLLRETLHRPHDVIDHQPLELTKGRRSLLQLASQQILNPGQAQIGQRIADPCGNAPEILRRAGTLERQRLLLHDPAMEDQHQECHALMDRHKLQVAEAQQVGGTRRCDQ